jgi:hypothetical protein
VVNQRKRRQRGNDVCERTLLRCSVPVLLSTWLTSIY